MAADKSNRRLGRGLDALFNEPGSPGSGRQDQDTALRDIPIKQIASNPFQPRKAFNSDELKELQESLQTSGLLQPVTVRTSPSGTGFELIAGERRLRAASAVGWETIPAVVKEMSDQEILTLALVENLQRSDLNPVEEAEGYDQLIRDFGHTQQSVATMVGKDRSTVANVLRILQLPAQVRTLIEHGTLTAGQARPLLGLEKSGEISRYAKLAVEKGWTAREVERHVREATGPRKGAQKRGRPRSIDTRSAEIRHVEQRLRKHLQTDVVISLKTGTRGTVSIEFYSPDDLGRIVELLGLPDSPQ